ncbi:MAG: TlpA disulfide reductase family protein [Bacteroidales bacterium]
MRNIYLKIIFFILFFYLFINFSFGQQSVKLTLRNSKFTQAYFCSIYGQKLNVIIAKKFSGNIIEFKFASSIPKGMYRIFMTDSAFIDIVIDRDAEIVMDTYYPDLTDSMKVSKGEDNKTYFKYIQYKNRELNKLTKLISLIKPEGQKKQNPLADKRVSFIEGCITYDIQQYSESLINRDTTLFVSKVIKAMLLPNMNIYLLKHPDSKVYNNDLEYLLFHFFDNINFADSSFLHTDFYYRTIKYYIEKLVLPRNVIGFNYANDFILNKAKLNEKIHNYCIAILIDLYENTQLEDVFVKLYDDYLVKNPKIISDERFASLTDKINIIKSLKPGTIAPDIAGKDTLGNEVKLSDIKSDFVLLMIWAADSKHSEQTITQLDELYKKYKSNGFEIYAISLDSTETLWKPALRKLKPEWTNVINIQSSKDQVYKHYNTWVLPGLYIMDKKRVILAKLMTVDYLKKELESAFTKK